MVGASLENSDSVNDSERKSLEKSIEQLFIYRFSGKSGCDGSPMGWLQRWTIMNI